MSPHPQPTTRHSPPTILVVDDEPHILACLRDRLTRDGLAVLEAETGPAALDLLAAAAPDLLILDVMLPAGGLDGLDVLRRLRAAGHNLPVILLTARADDVDRIVGLELGADDYVVKPFNPRELSARVRAVLRRQAEVARLEARLKELEGRQGAGLELDPARRLAWLNGQPLDLRPREFDLLHCLAQHRGRVLRRDELLDRVWGESRFIDPRTVDVHVRRLRARLAELDPSAAGLILTERGIGYRLAIDA